MFSFRWMSLTLVCLTNHIKTRCELTWIQIRVSVELWLHLLFDYFLILQVLLCLCKFTQKSEFGIKFPAAHTFRELGQNDALFYFPYIFIFQDPLVWEILRGLWTLNQHEWLLQLWRGTIFIFFCRLLTTIASIGRLELFSLQANLNM